MFEQNPFVSPGTADFSTHMWEGIVMLIIPFVLGIILGNLIWGKWRKKYTDEVTNSNNLKAELKGVRAEVEVANEDKINLQVENNKLNSQYELAAASMNSLRVKNSDLEADLDLLRSKNESLQEEISTTVEATDETIDAVEELDETIGDIDLSTGIHTDEVESIEIDIEPVVETSEVVAMASAPEEMLEIEVEPIEELDIVIEPMDELDIEMEPMADELEVSAEAVVEAEMPELDIVDEPMSIEVEELVPELGVSNVEVEMEAPELDEVSLAAAEDMVMEEEVDIIIESLDEDLDIEEEPEESIEVVVDVIEVDTEPDAIIIEEMVESNGTSVETVPLSRVRQVEAENALLLDRLNAIEAKLEGITPMSAGMVTKDTLNQVESENEAMKLRMAEMEDRLNYLAQFEPIEPDNLKLVEGIGPKIEQLLNDAGIYTWQKLADTDPDDIKGILVAAGSRYQMHDPTTWPEQSSMAARGEFDQLKKWQDKLDGGKA